MGKEGDRKGVFMIKNTDIIWQASCAVAVVVLVGFGAVGSIGNGQLSVILFFDALNSFAN